MKIQLCHPEIPKFPSAKTPRGNSLQKREKVEREREVEEEKRERERERERERVQGINGGGEEREEIE